MQCAAKKWVGDRTVRCDREAVTIDDGWWVCAECAAQFRANRKEKP